MRVNFARIVILSVGVVAGINLFLDSALLWGLLSLCAIFSGTLTINRLFEFRGYVSRLIPGYLLLIAAVLLSGYTLSALRLLGSPWAWFVAGVLFWGAARCIQKFRRRRAPFSVHAPAGAILGDFFRHGVSLLKEMRDEKNPARRAALYILLGGFIAAHLLGLGSALLTPPNNWDVMTYHAPRTAVYIQQGSFRHFDANYWAQNVHPKNAPVLQVFTWIASGGSERLMFVVQYSACLIAMLCVYGISGFAGAHRNGRLLAALLFGLLTDVLMQSTTQQNDLLIAAFTGAAVYGVLARRILPPRLGAGVFAAAFGIGLGTKLTFLLVVPALVFIVLFTFRKSRAEDGRTGWKGLGEWLAPAAAGVVLFALPAGYIENVIVYGHPFGPVNVRAMHAYPAGDLPGVLKGGFVNSLRYGADFINLDGLPRVNTVLKVNRLIRAPYEMVWEALPEGLQTAGGERGLFKIHKTPRSHEDSSWWGAAGVALLGPMLWLVLFRILRVPSGARMLAGAFVLFFLAQAFSGPYDPWRGRYFIAGALFAAPLAAFLFSPKTLKRSALYPLAVLFLVALSGVTSVLVREHRSYVRFTGQTSFFHLNRLQVMTAQNPGMYSIVAQYENLAPLRGVTALLVGDNQYVYPFFGEKLERRVIPVSQMRRLPGGLTGLVFRFPLEAPREGDIHLGSRWYYRPLP